MVKPLTDEQIWGVPPDQVPDAEEKEYEVCPIAGTCCTYYRDGLCHSLGRYCVLDLDNGM